MPWKEQRYCSRSCAKSAMPPENRHRKLTQAQVDEIRRRYAPRPAMKELAREFHVSHGMISRIVNHRGWRKYSDYPDEARTQKQARRYKVKKTETVTIEELRRRANARFFGEDMMKKSAMIVLFLVGLTMGCCEAQQSSPGTVTFSSPTSLNTNVTFSSTGTYFIQFSAFDGAKTSTQVVTVTVLPAAVVSNLIIRNGSAIAGSSVTFPVSFQVGTSTVSAIQFDVVLPPGVSTNTVAANVVAIDAALTAGKSATGNAVSPTTYRVIVSGLNQNRIWAGGLVNLTFQLDASLPTSTVAIGITNIVASDQNGVTVPITGVGGTIAVTANLAPIVNVVPLNQTVTLPGTATLSAAATDDGAPNPPGALVYSWTVL